MITVRIRNAAEAYRAYTSVDAGIRAAIRRGLAAAAFRAVHTLQVETQRKAFNTGAMARAWSATPTRTGALVTNSLPYAPVMEYGRRPGAPMPPVSEIELWVRRKLVKQLRADASNLGWMRKMRGQKPGRKSDRFEREVKSAAWAIAKSIAKKGIKPRNIVLGVLPKLQRDAYTECRRELRTGQIALAMEASRAPGAPGRK